MHKSGFVSVVGRPNVGKSTLLNRILKEKLSITSNKAQTTRNKITMIHTDDRGQIVFLDTPGIQSPKNKLGDYMLKTSVSSMEGVDVILMVVDMSDYLGPKDKMILEAMDKEGKDIPAILVINKVDMAPRDEVCRHGTLRRHRPRLRLKGRKCGPPVGCDLRALAGRAPILP